MLRSADGAIAFEGVGVTGGDVLDLRAMYSTFLSPKMWIGAAAGALMIAIAVRLRRWREEI